jgi:hypothetical protein
MDDAADSDLNHMESPIMLVTRCPFKGVIEITDRNDVSADSEGHGRSESQGRKASYGESATRNEASIAFALGNEL